MKRKQARRPAAEWSRLVEAWRRSGQPQKDYARKARISPKSLAWWAWKLGTPRQKLPTTPEPTFQPVRIIEAGPETGTVSILHDGGFTISVTGRVDIHQLRAVLSAVRTC